VYKETVWDLDMTKYNYSRPADDPKAPGDVYDPVFKGQSPEGAPVIGEYTLEAKADRSINTLGSDFTAKGFKGKDTRVWIYRQTNAHDSRIYSASLVRERSDYLVATIDGGEPYGMYLMWVENALGSSYPVRINAAEATWLGPDHATAGGRVSIYGRNLSHEHGTTRSYVYIRRWGTDATVKSIPVKVTEVNPYKVTFEVPADVEKNGDYEVWVHNGHGGEYGWSGPLKLHIDSSDPYIWSGKRINVKTYGAKGDGQTDDSRAIQSAIESAQDGDRIYFPAGTYKLLSGSLESNKKLSFEGMGGDRSILLTDSGFSQAQMLYIKGFPSRVEGLGFKTQKPDGQGLKILLRAEGVGEGEETRGFIVRDSRFETAAFGGNAVATNLYGINCISIEHVSDAHVSHNYFTSQVAVSGYVCRELFVQDNTIYGNWKVTHGNGNLMLSFSGNIRKADISNNYFQSVDHEGPVKDGDRVIVRAIVFQNWHGGRMDRIYIGKNRVERAGNPWDNSGEIILFELPADNRAYSLGSVEGETMTLTGLRSRRANNLTNETIAIVKNKGIGQYRRIIASKGNQITVDRPWDIQPDKTSAFTLCTSASDVMVYKNTIIGIPNYHLQENATSGIQLFGCGFDCVIDNNNFSYAHHGIFICGDTGDSTMSGSLSTGPMGNLITDNTVNNTVYGLENIVAMYPNGIPTPQPNEIPWSSNVNNVFRDNQVSDIKQFTIRGTLNGGYGILVGQLYNDWQNPIWNGPWVQKSLIEHNTVTDASSKYIWLRQHQQYTTVRENNFVDNNKYPGTTGVYFSPQNKDACIVGNMFSRDVDTLYGGALPGPSLQLSQRSLIFDITGNTDELSKTLIIRNGGTGSLNLSVSHDVGWITTSLDNPEIKDKQDSSVLKVHIQSRRRLRPGIYQGTITIYPGTSTAYKTVGVKLIVKDENSAGL
jgi:polygalacturonase